jgi:thiol-disulfide isomerase/thioredoxin
MNLANRYEEECFSLISKINPGKGIAVWMEAYTRFLFSEIKYAYGERNKIEHGNKYFEFLVDLDSLGLHMKSCTETYEFIQQYYDYQLEKEGFDKSLQLAYNKDDYYTYAKGNMAFVSENPTNLNKLALAGILYPVVDYNYQVIDSLITEYTDVVQDKYLSEVIKERIKYNKNVNEALKAFTLDSLSNLKPVSEIFKEITENNRNKVLYFDFWGTSCKYCIDEFPASVKLKKTVEGKNIEFIYFCAPSEIKKQQEIIQRYNLEGKHYMLTRDQLRTLNAHFGFLALPRYMLVDKHGNFIDTNAKKPSSDKILSELYELADE